MKRDKSIDIVRAMSILMILFYHGWVLCGSWALGVDVLTLFIKLSGEIGVTIFFLISGYGIYLSINNMDTANDLSFKKFIIKRIIRIGPSYWLSLIVAILFMDGAYYLSKQGTMNIVSHFLLIHNLFPEFHGAINGALWTMGVIFQFYVFAILLYKGVKKNKYVFGIIAVVFTIVSKIVIYKCVLPIVGQEYAFWGGRQLFTALDNFVLGMLLANIKSKNGKIKNNECSNRKCIIAIAFLIVGLWGLCKSGLNNGIHTDNISGYTWHSILAIILVLLMYYFSLLKLNYNTFVMKRLLWISKCEYEIYLWHLIMFNNLIGKAPFIKQLLDDGHSIVAQLSRQKSKIFIMN